MNKTTAGWTTFIVALGMMSGLLSSDISKLVTWSQIYQPAFVAIIMAHFATVVLAFAAGKMIPESRSSGERTRAEDKNV